MLFFDVLFQAFDGEVGIGLQKLRIGTGLKKGGEIDLEAFEAGLEAP